MKLTKRNVYQSQVNEYQIDSPCPSNLTYFWNFGSLQGFIMQVVIISGITQAFHYCSNIDLAFSSVEHITRDVNNGWLIRYVHANAVGFFFILTYIHIGRGLYMGSYRAPRTQQWNIGVIILILQMAIAFIGYVLPFGQMSQWGSIVICSLFSAIPWIGDSIVALQWGGFTVAGPTLSRFFALHYLLPFILAALVIMHLMALHLHGSGNPIGISSTADRIRFHPYYTSKDLVGIFWLVIILSIFIFYYPNLLGHSDNFIPANPQVTPISIVPEFYLQPFYAIQRAIPSKLGGVIAMFMALLILIPISFFHTLNLRSQRHRPLQEIAFWFFVFNFLFQLVLGAKPIHEPYILLGQFATFNYFFYFIFLMIIG